jgi:rhomboid protease GluP
LGVIPVPSTATSAIVAVTIAIYALSWYMTQNAASAELRPSPAWDGIDGRVLMRLGAKSVLLFAGQWWRLVTAVFLHAGLLHIGINIWCLVDLGPEVESLFSTAKFVVMYLVTGVAGFLLSAVWNPLVLSVGASGAVLGLIGVLIGTSLHHGGLGKDYRRQLWRWVIYILIFGLLPFSGVDNAAHIGGLVIGCILGYLIPEGEPSTSRGENVWNALALVSVLVIAGSFTLMALQLNAYPR